MAVVITGFLGNHNLPFARYVKLRAAHAPEMPVAFSPPPWLSNPVMHHGKCVARRPWCMPGSLTSGFFWSRWRGKRSRQSRCMRNTQFYVSGRMPITWHAQWNLNWAILDPDLVRINAFDADSIQRRHEVLPIWINSSTDDFIIIPCTCNHIISHEDSVVSRISHIAVLHSNPINVYQTREDTTNFVCRIYVPVTNLYRRFCTHMAPFTHTV